MQVWQVHLQLLANLPSCMEGCVSLCLELLSQNAEQSSHQQISGQLLVEPTEPQIGYVLAISEKAISPMLYHEDLLEYQSNGHVLAEIQGSILCWSHPKHLRNLSEIRRLPPEARSACHLSIFPQA